MSQVFWKEFPKINRRVAFQSNYAGIAGTSLGCHCGTISGVSASFGTGYYAALNGQNIQVIDTKEEKPIHYTLDRYDGTSKAPRGEVTKILAHFKEIGLNSKSFSDDLFKGVVEKCSSLPLWVMSDVVNYQAPCRKVLQDDDLDGEYGGATYRSYATTGEFAQYLIDNKIGYILASPIVQNPSHRSKSNYSLNRGWFWVPPTQLERAIDVTEVFGHDLLPTKEAWALTVGMDLNILDPEKLFAHTFNTGNFPETGRFLRRGKDGRFIAKEA